MDFAFVTHNVVHLHAAPSRDAERVSQTRLGRRVAVLSTSDDGSWARVQDDDTYRGWAERRWLTETPAALPERLVTATFATVRSEARADASLVVRLSVGDHVAAGPQLGDWVPVTLPGGEHGWLHYTALEPLLLPEPESVGAVGARLGREFLGTPYLWGGSSAFGLDCSGLVQLCFRLVGLILRRDADIQRSDPRFVPVAFPDLLPGDLVFFGTPEKITHVGIHVADGVFLHSAGGAGVILTEWGDARYSPGYVDARRLDPALANLPVTRFEAENR